MPVCLKCGWEIVFGPGGCACTQAARRARVFDEAAKSAERLNKLLTPKAKRELRKIAKKMKGKS